MSGLNKSNEKMMAKCASDSQPSSDDTNSGGDAEGNNRLKKGPWTSAEDAILVEYVTKNGEGNWNAVRKRTGLARCGKSCRLRWANHLRSDLKKGSFSPEEENLIIELHAKMGNKWARMAAELPGRTDNEIKNYWNTRLKRRQRAGLPIYPPELCLQALNENQQNDDITGDVDLISANSFEIPPIEFKNLELNQVVYSPPFPDITGSTLLDIPANSLRGQCLHSSYPNKPLFSTLHPSKRFRGSESLYPCLSQYQNVSYAQNAQFCMYSSMYDHNLISNEASSSSVIDGNHQNAVLNGNPSSSEPNWETKLELPSDQTQVDNWGSPSSLLPPLKSIDTLIQNPPTEHSLSCHLPCQNSGLLDAVLHESQTMRNPRSSSHHALDTAPQVIYETGWDPYGELTSPLGYSSSFSEGTTPISGNSFDEPELVEPIPGTIWAPMHYEDNVVTENQIFSKPDLWKDNTKNSGHSHD